MSQSDLSLKAHTIEERITRLEKIFKEIQERISVIEAKLDTPIQLMKRR